MNATISINESSVNYKYKDKSQIDFYECIN